MPAAVGEAPALRQAVDVGVDWESLSAERLRPEQTRLLSSIKLIGKVNIDHNIWKLFAVTHRESEDGAGG